MKKTLLTLGLIFAFATNTNAASLCSYQEQTEINQKAANVRAEYEITQENRLVDPANLGLSEEEINANPNGVEVPYDIFNISILNVTDDFYVVVKNDQTHEEKTYTSSDAENGIISFKWDIVDEITNFTIEVYTTNKTSCPGELYKTIYRTTPRKNEFARREICNDLKDFYLCQEYVTFPEMDSEKFLTQLESYQNGKINNKGEEQKDNKPLSTTDKIFDFIDSYKWVIIVVLVIAVGGFAVTKIVENKKQRDRL